MKTQRGKQGQSHWACVPACQFRLWTAATALVTIMVLLASQGTYRGPVHAQSSVGTPASEARSPEIGPQAWIEYPLDGETFPLEPLTFDVYATDAGGVARVDLQLNAEYLPIQQIKSASADGSNRLIHLAYRWEPLTAGEYALEARGVNAAGAAGEASTVTFCIVSCEAAGTPAPPPITTTPRTLIMPTDTPKPAAPVMVKPTDTAAPPPQPAYDLYVRRMDYTSPHPQVGETIQMAIMLATDIAPQGAPFFPASHFRWRQGPTFPWNEDSCPDNTQYASCVKNVTLSYAQPGSYVVEVEADHLQEIAETNETNNTKAWTIVVGQPTPTHTPAPGYDLYVRRMDYVPPSPTVGEGIQMSVMIATDFAPQGAPYFPASHFRWRQSPAFPWNEETCPNNTQYASCLKNIAFTYNQPGSYVFEVQADNRMEVPEADEMNNTKTWNIVVGQSQPITPTPTPMPPPASMSINFRSDVPYVNAGACTTLRWDVDGVQAVYLNGQGVTGHESRQVCPCEPTAYRLEVTKQNGERESRDVFIDVYGTCQTEPEPEPGGDIYPPGYPSGGPSASDTVGPGIDGVGVSWAACEFLGYATVNDPSGVGWAQFHFSFDGTWHSLWMADRGGGYWETEVGAQAPSINGNIQYYVIASDSLGNQSESGSGSEGYQCSVNY